MQYYTLIFTERVSVLLLEFNRKALVVKAMTGVMRFFIH